MSTVSIQPDLIQWARERASLSVDQLAPKVGTPKNPAPLAEWENSEEPIEIQVRQLEKLAKATHAPFAMLFLLEAPEEPLPIRDFRRAPGGPRRPSLDLLETVYQNQLRQQWLSEVFQDDELDPLPFVGSVTTNSPVTQVAESIRSTLNIGTNERRKLGRGVDVVLWMIERLEEAGITVIRKGYAGTNTRRALRKEEFKGFALADKFAPLIFINGKDWPNSQVFTVIHECAHLWLGESAVPSGEWFGDPGDPVERFCNQVAAEVLVPAAEIRELWQNAASVEENVQRLSGHFRVSGLTAAFRARNTNLISDATLDGVRGSLQAAFDAEGESASKKSSGGNFYNNQGVHLGKRFMREVLARTLEGRTLYSEAFDLLGTRKTSVIKEMAARFL